MFYFKPIYTKFNINNDNDERKFEFYILIFKKML